MAHAGVERARDLPQLRLELCERVERVERGGLDLDRHVAVRVDELGELGDELGLVQEQLRLDRTLERRVREDGDCEQAHDEHSATLFGRVERLGDANLLEEVEPV